MGWLYSLKEFLDTRWDKPYKYVAGAIALLTFAGLWTHHAVLETLAGMLGWLGADSWAANVLTAHEWLLSHAGFALTLNDSSLSVVEAVVSLGLAVFAGFADQAENPPSRAASTFWVLAGLATYTAASPATYVWFIVGGLVVRAFVRKQGPVRVLWEFGADVGGALLIIPGVPVLLLLSRPSKPSQNTPGGASAG